MALRENNVGNVLDMSTNTEFLLVLHLQLRLTWVEYGRY